MGFINFLVDVAQDYTSFGDLTVTIMTLTVMFITAIVGVAVILNGLVRTFRR